MFFELVALDSLPDKIKPSPAGNANYFFTFERHSARLSTTQPAYVPRWIWKNGSVDFFGPRNTQNALPLLYGEPRRTAVHSSSIVSRIFL
jgi:hypothetical protein